MGVELECRCYPLYAKILLLKLKNSGKWDEARAFFEEVKQFRWMGSKKTFEPGQAIKWDSFNHTPQIWVPNMRAVPVWPREMWDSLPIAHNLEKHYETLKKEVNIVLQHAPEEWAPTYRFLFAEGDWSQVLLYNGRVSPRMRPVVPGDLQAPSPVAPVEARPTVGVGSERAGSLPPNEARH